MASVIMDNEIKSRLTDGITMDSTHIETLQLLGLRKLARQIHILSKNQTPPLISLGVLCYDGCTTTLDKQAIFIQENTEKESKGP